MASIEIRPIDRARVAQLVTAQLMDDLDMFAAAIDAAADDPRDESITVLLHLLSLNLAGMLADIHGNAAIPLMRTALAQRLADDDR